MPAVTIDLDVQLENLVGLKTDLEEHYWSIVEHADSTLRFSLSMVLSLLTSRIGAFEVVVRQHGGGEVTVGRLSLDEQNVIERSLALFDGEFVVDADAPPARFWAMARALLSAVDDLLLAAARAESARSVDHDRGPRPGVVLPLARSSR